MRAPDGIHARLGKPQVAHLTLFHQPAHRSNRFFDGHLRVHAMLVIQINRRDAQPPQAGLAALLHIFRTPAHTPCRGIRGVAHDSEFCRDDHFVAALLDGSPHQLFIAPDSVDVRCIQQGDAMVHGVLNGGDGLGFVRRAVKFRHAHAAQSQRGHYERAFPQPAVLHTCFLKRMAFFN